MFHGSMVALVTPFKNDCVDTDQLKLLVEWHISAGTTAIVAAGTTGESGTLSIDERMLVIKTVVEQAAERILVIAGTGANSTKECIELTRLAQHMGAHAALIMTPAYIKPTQEGLYQHYKQIAASVPIPIILYNVPSRTACDMLPETVGRLSHISNIIAIKEATADKGRLADLLTATANRMDIFSGDDATAVDWMLNGAKGVISVAANVAPNLIAQAANLALSNDSDAALTFDKQLQSLYRLLFVESNPIPAKWALHALGLINNELRLPLTPLSEPFHAEFLSVINQLK